MENRSDLLKKIDRILGCEGLMMDNFLSLPVGEHIVDEDMHYIGLSKDCCIVYPQQFITKPTAMLISLLLNELIVRDAQENGPTQLLKRVLIGNDDLSILDVQGAGIEPSGVFIPMVMEIRHVSGSWWELFYSYFTDRVIGVSLEEYFYALIPTEAVALDPQNRLELEELGTGFAGILQEEGIEARGICYGEPVTDVTRWKEAFKKTKNALRSGKAFYPDHLVYFSWKMILENLIHSVPFDTARDYIREILGPTLSTTFDHEIYKTVYKLIQENFNLSETARQLFIHRNTLLYRLERVKEETEKDLRVSEDAFKFYLAMVLLKRFTN